MTVPQDLPYILTEQNQFALDDILTTRFQTYPHVQPYPTPPGMAEPDFLFFPFYSTLHTILGGKCPNPPEYYETVQEVTDDFLAFAAALPNSTYPRLILPISLCRVDQNKGILTQQRMAKLRDRVLCTSSFLTGLADRFSARNRDGPAVPEGGDEGRDRRSVSHSVPSPA